MRKMKPVHDHTILYVDDDRDDLEMLQQAIRELDGKFQVVEALDGEQGITFLQHMKMNGHLPCLIILDVNMPRMDGRQTLNMIRADEQLRSIPIVIFSTSDSELDRIYFKGMKVEYITKPVNFSHLVEVAARLIHFCAN